MRAQRRRRVTSCPSWGLLKLLDGGQRTCLTSTRISCELWKPCVLEPSADHVIKGDLLEVLIQSQNPQNLHIVAYRHARVSGLNFVKRGPGDVYPLRNQGGGVATPQSSQAQAFSESCKCATGFWEEQRGFCRHVGVQAACMSSILAKFGLNC